MPTVPPQPWQGRQPEPERTPDGRDIVRTRFGLHTRRPDGLLEPYETPAQLAEKLFRKPQRPINAAGDWDVW